MIHLVTWWLAELDKACLVFIIAKIKLIDFARDFYFFFLLSLLFFPCTARCQSLNLLPDGGSGIFLEGFKSFSY